MNKSIEELRQDVIDAAKMWRNGSAIDVRNLLAGLDAAVDALRAAEAEDSPARRNTPDDDLLPLSRLEKAMSIESSPSAGLTEDDKAWLRRVATVEIGSNLQIACSLIHRLSASLAEREAEIAQAKLYLTNLFRTCAPQCEPMTDLAGLCTQIDNYIAGLRNVPASEGGAS